MKILIRPLPQYSEALSAKHVWMASVALILILGTERKYNMQNAKPTEFKPHEF